MDDFMGSDSQQQKKRFHVRRLKIPYLVIYYLPSKSMSQVYCYILKNMYPFPSDLSGCTAKSYGLGEA